MDTTAQALLAVAGLAALGDWIAVASDRRPVEYVLKPAVMVALLGVAAVAEGPGGVVRTWLVVALTLSLVGDVLLMLPHDRFLEGLGAFLGAHAAYVVALVGLGTSAVAATVGAGAIAVVALPVGLRLVRSLGTSRLVTPVVAYAAALSLTVVAAIATRDALAVAGALAFATSDGLLGWSRFVRAFPHDRVTVHVTYHLGQVGLVLALAT